MASFVGMNDASGRDQFLNKRYAVRFGAGQGRDLAALPFPSNDNDAALAGLMLDAAPNDSIDFEIGGADAAAE